MTNVYDHKGDFLMPYPPFADRAYRDGTWLGDYVVWALHGSTPVADRPGIFQIFYVDITAIVVPLGLQLFTAEDERLFRLWADNHDERYPRALRFDPATGEAVTA